MRTERVVSWGACRNTHGHAGVQRGVVSTVLTCVKSLHSPLRKVLPASALRDTTRGSERGGGLPQVTQEVRTEVGFGLPWNSEVVRVLRSLH